MCIIVSMGADLANGCSTIFTGAGLANEAGLFKETTNDLSKKNDAFLRDVHGTGRKAGK